MPVAHGILEQYSPIVVWPRVNHPERKTDCDWSDMSGRLTKRILLAALLASLILIALVTISRIVPAQTSRGERTLHIAGYAGDAKLVMMNGRSYIDLETLARLTGGSLEFEGNRIVLTLAAANPRGAGSAGNQAATPGFSREFMKAAIESMAAMREWGSTLKLAIENGYPVGNAMSGYQHHAADSVRLASATALTDSDRSGLQLLTSEFNNVQAWSDELVKARNSMSAANLATSEDALVNDPLFQKILRCGQFLIPMFASGTFQDDAACH